MRRTLALLAVVGLVAVGCGGDGATDAGPVPGRPETTVETTVAPEGPITVTPGPGSAPATTTSGTFQVAVWFAKGEALEPVNRTVPRVPGIGGEAVKALLAGPTAAESRAGFTTAIPKDTRFLGLVIDGAGIARVDLSRDFESGGGSLGLTMRLGQVACTVAQFPTVKGVRFALAGELVSVFSGNGIVLDKPVTCDSYREVLGQPPDTPASVGIWPFAVRSDVAAYEPGADRTFTDPVATARAFATRYLGMDNPVDFGFRAGAGGGTVALGPRYGEGRTPLPNPQPTFTAVLQQLGGQGTTGYWTVSEVTSPNIVVTAPAAGTKVGSPVRLTGQAHAFEGNVNVEVREDGMLAGQSLGKGFVTGGGDMLRPFNGSVGFRAPSKPAGAVVFTEVSPADGQGILRAAVVRVFF
ncbi:MAG: GerMN domain-containing protein [Actinomycetota bacterium]|nr:GerMN domain-containing protein [Actinomycetota bacterium]